MSMMSGCRSILRRVAGLGLMAGGLVFLWSFPVRSVINCNRSAGVYELAQIGLVRTISQAKLQIDQIRSAEVVGEWQHDPQRGRMYCKTATFVMADGRQLPME